MSESVIVTEIINNVIVNESINDVVVATPGPQGPRGKTILNGIGVPANNLGTEGDYYYNKESAQFYGPKLVDNSWANCAIINLAGQTQAFEYSWELPQIVGPQIDVSYSLLITHNLSFKPNVTIKNSAGDVLETGIEYNSINQITLIMAQPFSGTAYLS